MWPRNIAIISIAATEWTMCAICMSPRRYCRPGSILSSTRPEPTTNEAEHEHAAPEDDLLAGVEALRRRLLAAEHAAALGQPAQVAAAREVAADEGQVKNDDQRDREQRADEVVRRLQRIGQPAEQRSADHRQQEELAERHHQARHREDAEGDRVAPVRGTLEVGEALDHAPGVRARARRSAPWPSSTARARTIMIRTSAPP